MDSDIGINGFFVFRFISPALRWLGWLTVLLYVVVALTVLGLRHILLPNVDHYKPYIEAQLSALVGSRVSVGQVSAQWYGLNPRVEMKHIALRDSQGAQVLAIPQLAFVVSWRSFLTLSPQFVSVHAGGVDMSIRRDSQKRLWLLGHRVDDTVSGHDNSELGNTTVQWLASQPQIRLYDSTIRWHDESRSAAPLVLQDVNLKIRNRARQHQFSLAARPAGSLGGSFDMRGNFRRAAGHERPLALETGQGQLYIYLDDMRPEAWLPWFDWPSFLHSDRVSTQMWLKLDRGEVVYVTTDVRVRDAVWQLADKQAVHGRNAHFQARGPRRQFQNLLLPSPESAPQSGSRDAADSGAQKLDFSVQARDLQLVFSDHYAQPLQIDTFSVAGTAGRSQGELILHVRDFAVQNDDVDATGHLTWTRQSGSATGYVDGSLAVRRAELAAVYRYMPHWLDDDVRDWLKVGLPAGQIYDANVVLQGNLSEFPFAEPGSDGVFRIQGDYRDAIIDYIPAEGKTPGWPRLNAVQGQIDLDRASLHIHADSAQIEPQDNAPVYLEDVDVTIADLQNDSVLEATGNTHGDGAAYMAFVRQSPLGAMLEHTFDQTQAQGEWRLPLDLTIPLAHSEGARVNGIIQIKDGSIQMDAGQPGFSHIQARIPFTQDALVAESLSARFLNENVQISGGVGTDQPGLRMAGTIDAGMLASLFDVPGMKRLSGKTAYRATLTGVGQKTGKQIAKLDIESDLKGMALDFPPPMKKAADLAWPLRVVWSYGKVPGNRTLDVTLNRTIQGRFQHRQRESASSYFQAGSIGVGRPAQWPDSGLSVDIEYPAFDGDVWDAITREFEPAPSDSVTPVLLPKISTLRLQTARGRLLGLSLDELTYTVKQTSPDEWRADISSTQTAGTLTWKEAGGHVQGPVKAVFHRLSIGDDTRADADSQTRDAVEAAQADRVVADDLQVPAVNLIVDNLRLYGRDVGKLALVGVNENRGDTWRLEQFALSSPAAHLEGSGEWRLRGKGRGLSLDANVDVSDLGAYFDQIGFTDVLSGGEGTVHGKIDWHDLPWTFDQNKIDGRISFEFVKGRLSTLKSKSARLLELISLQSIRRLATLDLNPMTLTRDGFPYDVLRGVVRLERGTVHTEDYRIVGPVGTIVLDGLVYLSTGKLDLQAVVIPNLDVSGAAIAAGIAINPVVGIGAFLTQWLLKAPLAAAMTVQYTIGGDWDTPEIQTSERIRGSMPGAD